MKRTFIRSLNATITQVFAFAKHTEKTWRKINAFNHMAMAQVGVAYITGERKVTA